jgi:hypothetical protein
VRKIQSTFLTRRKYSENILGGRTPFSGGCHVILRAMNTNCMRDPSFHDPNAHWPAGAPPAAADESAREPETASPADAEAAAAGRGRPSGRTPDKVHAVCSFIRLTGLSDTAAAAMAGVKRSTLARWKQEDEEVELLLDQARFQYQAPRLEKIGETRLKDGQLDWRAQAWLVKFANPEVYGAPSRRRKLREVELTPEEEPLTPEEQAGKEEHEAMEQLVEAQKDWDAYFKSGRQITPAMLALIQQRRAIALREMNAVKPAATTPEGNAAEEAAKSVTIRPRIRSVYRDSGGWAGATGAEAPAAMERIRMEAMTG